MSTPLASLTDFEVRLGRPLEGPEAARAEAALSDASEIIRAHAETNWSEGEVPGAIQVITLAAARRVWDNPDGRTSTTEGLGAHNEGATWANPTTDVYLTASEKATIDKVVGRRSGLGTISITRGPLETAGADYLPVTYEPSGLPGKPMPWIDRVDDLS